MTDAIKDPPLYAMFYDNGGRHGVSEAGCAARAGIYNPDTGREATSIEAYEMGLKAATQWQPIETAPRDGTHILLLAQRFQGDYIGNYRFENGRWWNHWGFLMEDTPTHWMPLPQPPTKEVKL